jgi:zinc/manganese transport system substrate-binding protein
MPRPRSPRSRTAALSVGLAAGLLLAGCGAPDDRADATSQDDAAGAIPVVASTDVWGDIAAAVGGDAVRVTSVISEPSQDPHSFEASSSTLLALSRARLVVENGGGYDDFLQQMGDSGGSDAAVVTAVTVAGEPTLRSGEPNEHLWYDLRSVRKVADEIAARLGEIEPSEADGFTARAARFGARVEALQAQEAALRAQVSGKRIAVTEPVPLFLTEACGLVDATPPEFSQAVEEGDDVSPAVLQETLDLVSTGSVDALVSNQQTSGPVTERVTAAAKGAGVPVVPVTETLPEGRSYLSWMRDNLDHLRTALAAR